MKPSESLDAHTKEVLKTIANGTSRDEVKKVLAEYIISLLRSVEVEDLVEIKNDDDQIRIGLKMNINKTNAAWRKLRDSLIQDLSK